MTNKKVFELANKEANEFNTPGKNIKTFKTYVHSKQEALLKHIIRSPSDDPLRQATLKFNSPLPATPLLRRVGRPRTLWADAIYSRIWNREYNTNNLFKFKDNYEANIKRVADAAKLRAI